MPLLYTNFLGKKVELTLVNGDKVIGIIASSDDHFVQLRDVNSEQSSKVWVVTDKIVSLIELS